MCTDVYIRVTGLFSIFHRRSLIFHLPFVSADQMENEKWKMENGGFNLEVQL
jgi:hypothetical protein